MSIFRKWVPHLKLQISSPDIVTPPTAWCGCPVREAPPPRPDKLPLEPTEANIDKMKQYILDRFASSTLNTCPHNPIPLMSPPIKIHVDPDAVPRCSPHPCSSSSPLARGGKTSIRHGCSTWCH